MLLLKIVSYELDFLIFKESQDLSGVCGDDIFMIFNPFVRVLLQYVAENLSLHM